MVKCSWRGGDSVEDLNIDFKEIYNRAISNISKLEGNDTATKVANEIVYTAALVCLELLKQYHVELVKELCRAYSNQFQ